VPEQDAHWQQANSEAGCRRSRNWAASDNHIARAKTPCSFTVVFYGLINFSRKTAQFCATRRESEWAKHLASATVRKPVKMSAKTLS
jgi:hypothetical protein